MFKTRNRTRTRKLRKQSRTIPVPGNADRGNGEDAGKYFRCWHCGFICNVERDSLGDRDSTDGVSRSATFIDYSDDAASVMGQLYSMAQTTCRLSESAHMVPKGEKVYEIDVTGCSLCGCRNWKGDY